MGHKKEEVAPDSANTGQAALNSPQMKQVEPHQLEMHHKLIQESLNKTTSPGISSHQELPDETLGQPSVLQVLVETLKEPLMGFTEQQQLPSRTSRELHETTKKSTYGATDAGRYPTGLHHHCSCRDCANFWLIEKKGHFSNPMCSMR